MCFKFYTIGITRHECICSFFGDVSVLKHEDIIHVFLTTVQYCIVWMDSHLFISLSNCGQICQFHAPLLWTALQQILVYLGPCGYALYFLWGWYRKGKFLVYSGADLGWLKRAYCYIFKIFVNWILNTDIIKN